MLKSRQNQVSLDIQAPLKTIITKDVSRSDTLKQEASDTQAPKDTEIERHARSMSLTSLQSMFTRRKRPNLQRSTSQLSTQSTTALSSCASASPSSIASSTFNKESTFSKLLGLFPLKGKNKSMLSLASTSVLPSQKSLEFEALLEEYPSRTIKTSLTPCTAA